MSGTNRSSNNSSADSEIKETIILQENVASSSNSLALETVIGDNYILNKFLKDSSNTTTPNNEVVKVLNQPVPKPRTKTKPIITRSNSNISTGTFVVASPRHVRQDTEVIEESTSKEMPVPKQRKSLIDKDEHNSIIMPSVSSKYGYKKIIEIVINKMDKIVLNPHVLHPVVKIHFVNISDGKYITKSEKSRAVVFNEGSDGRCNYILPVVTSCCNLREKRILTPQWNEHVLVNEDSNYLLNESVVIFFEVLDFTTICSDSQNGWVSIAFAFLKLQDKAKYLTNKTLRLQLYCCTNHQNASHDNKCDVWTNWYKRKLKKYPATIFVGVNEIEAPKKLTECSARKTLKNIVKDNIVKDKKVVKTKSNIPNKLFKTIGTFEDGCLITKFSNNGCYLAAALKIKDAFWIVLYLVDNDFKEYHTRFGYHNGLIYSINWSQDDGYLITTSADNTANIWDVAKGVLVQSLPHPSFVYTSDVSPSGSILTGCFDKTLRIWTYDKNMLKYFLSQELSRHKGYITSVVLAKMSLKPTAFSADSVGGIIQWNETNGEWSYQKHINILDLNETIINQILLFNNGKHMLVHARDSALRIISLANSCVIHWLHGALNSRVQTHCSLSPNGKIIACGSENDLVLLWNSKTGKEVFTYNAYGLNNGVHCVQFHPNKCILCVSSYGINNIPILIFSYNEDPSNATDAIRDNTSRSDLSKLITKDEFKRILSKMDNVINVLN